MIVIAEDEHFIYIKLVGSNVGGTLMRYCRQSMRIQIAGKDVRRGYLKHSIKKMCNRDGRYTEDEFWALWNKYKIERKRCEL